MKQIRTWHLFAAVASTLLVTLVVQSAIAAPASTRNGGSIRRVSVVREAVEQTTTSTSFVNVPGASTTITVPSGQRALILARFSAESNCSGGLVGNWCPARILIGGTEAAPASGADFAFDSVDSSEVAACTPGECGWESHSMDRSRGPLDPGTYNVRVQWMVENSFGGTSTFRLDDWSLTVERVKV